MLFLLNAYPHPTGPADPSETGVTWRVDEDADTALLIGWWLWL